MSSSMTKHERTRRRVLIWMALALSSHRRPACAAHFKKSATFFAQAIPGQVLHFPYDEGSHPDFRLEWWYLTGWLTKPGGSPSAFQITFFRTRPNVDTANPSTFAPRQIMIAHAALSERSYGRLRHDQRVSRAAFDLAGAKVGQLNLWLQDWSLRNENGEYRAHIPARDFSFDFTFTPTQPPMLQGESGFSRKAPDDKSASYYYSLPQLKTRGTLVVRNRKESVSGTAWFDHEWSSSYMDREAVGWDWTGINLADGGALMVFRMRDSRGRKLWAGGAYRSRNGQTDILDRHQILFEPRRIWQSPRTGTRYPVSWLIKTGKMEIVIEPLMDDQENDTRLSTGTIYWEGAVEALQHAKRIGRGYLELTGYWHRMNF